MVLPLLISCSIGIAVGLGWWAVYRPVALSLGRLILRPSRRKPRQRWIKGTQFVLSGQLPLAIWLGLFLPSPLTQVLLSFFVPVWIAVLGGGLVLIGLLAEVVTGSRKRFAIERTLLPVAVDNLLAHSSVDYSTRMLEYTLHSPDPVFRLVAVKGLTELGTATALKLLAKTTNDPDKEVRLASQRGSESIQKALGESKPMSVAGMPALFKEHAHWCEKLDSLTGQEFKTAGRKLIEMEHTMTEVVNSQISLRNSFPELWCVKCGSRSSENRYSRWRYVHCHRCGDVLAMRANVRFVIGRIGMREGHFEKRDLLMSVWDHSTRQPVFAEVDVLEICQDGVTDLEWAIASVVGAMMERWPERKKPVEIRLSGKVNLSENSVRLLRQLNPAFEVGKG